MIGSIPFTYRNKASTIKIGLHFQGGLAMKRLIKLLAIFMCIHFVVPLSVYASNNGVSKINQIHAYSVLKSCKLVDENIETRENDYVTRRQALYLAALIARDYIVTFNEEEQRNAMKSWGNRFSDIEINTPDCLLVITTYNLSGLFYGKVTTDHQVVAALDDYITYEEVGYLMLRLTDHSQQDESMLKYYHDGTWLKPFNTVYGFTITSEQRHNIIECGDFLYIVYNTLYRPYDSNCYGGLLKERLIDKYIGETEEASIGRFPDYNGLAS